MIMSCLRGLVNLRGSILSKEKQYWIWRFYSLVKGNKKFLQFKIASNRLISTEANLSFQKRLLKQKISMKYKTDQQNKHIKNNLRSKESSIDSVHVISKYQKIDMKKS